MIDTFPLEAATIMERAGRTKVMARGLRATLSVLPIRRDHTRYAFVTNDREAFRAWALRWYPQYCRGETEPVFRLREGMVTYPYDWAALVR